MSENGVVQRALTLAAAIAVLVAGAAFFMVLGGSGADAAGLAKQGVADISLRNEQINFQAAGSAPGPEFPVGLARMRFVVRNTGDVAVSIESTTPATSCVGRSVEAGKGVWCHAWIDMTHPAASPVPLSVSATDGSVTVSDDGEYHYQTEAPSLIPDVALTNIQLNSVAAGSAPGPEFEAGQAQVRFVARNTGDVPVTIESTTPASSCVGQVMQPGRGWWCRANVDLANPAVSPMPLAVTVTDGSTTATDLAEYHYQSVEPDLVPGITLLNSYFGSTTATSAPGPELPAGETSLRFVIRNTGDVVLTNISTTPASSCDNGELAVGRVRWCVASIVVAYPAPASNQMTISATGGGETVTSTRAYYYQVEPSPAVSLSGVRLGDSLAGSAPGPAAPAGEAELWFEVQNTGDVRLLGLATSPASSCDGFNLAVGQTRLCLAEVELVDPAVSPNSITVSVTGAGQSVTDAAEYHYQNEPAGVVVMNEIETSSGGGDWVEFYNPGTTPVDIAGYTLSDGGVSSYTIPSPAVVAPGAYLVLDRYSSFNFNFGIGEQAIFSDTTGTVVSAHSWTVHAANTWALCPDGMYRNSTTITKGAQNDCSTPPPGGAWPGGVTVSTVDPAATFDGDLSGLDYFEDESEGPLMWASVNGASRLYILREAANGQWVPDVYINDGVWGNGKAIRYTNGLGIVDAEGVTTADDAPAKVFVASERNDGQGQSGTSLNMVLRYNKYAPTSTLVAEMQWDLTSDLPATDANRGLEGITWVPDSVLTAQGFIDESTGEPYNPASYPGHGSGLFFLGLEQPNDPNANNLFAYALMDNGGVASFAQIASIDSGLPHVMALEFDTDTGDLWAVCDDKCLGDSSVLRINSVGEFESIGVYKRPITVGNLENEGFALAPLSECVTINSAPIRPVFWADDADTNGHSLREGTMTCRPL